MSRLPHRRYDATPRELRERMDAERTRLPHLILYDGDDHQRIIFLGEDRDRLTLGRRADGDIPLTWNPCVSRVHACLERLGPRDWVLEDNELSRHGTFVNGNRIRAHRLRGNDVISLGGVVQLLYRAPSDHRLEGDENETPPLAPALRLQLTPQKRAVLLELCRPYGQHRDPDTLPTNKEIAATLNLTVATVKEHLRDLSKVLGANTAPQNARRRLLRRRALEHDDIRELVLQFDSQQGGPFPP